MDRETLVQNKEIFEQNGFRFEIENGENNKIFVVLNSLPFIDSKLLFGKEDFLEIFNHVQDENSF